MANSTWGCYTIVESAEYLKVRKSYLQRLCLQNKLDNARMVEGKWYIPKRTLDAYQTRIALKRLRAKRKRNMLSPHLAPFIAS